MADDTRQTMKPPHTQEPPPFGRNWATLYAVVLANLAVLIALFYLFTRWFS